MNHRLRWTRREAIAAMGAAASALLAPGRTAKAAIENGLEIAEGFVFEDLDGEGRRTANSPGIAGVMVSNGRDVAITDRVGRWSLPVANGDTVFVIVPSQWKTASRGPRAFSYLHQPLGTPAALGLRSPVIGPTGPLPRSIDFALVRQTQLQSFDALLFADTQAADAKELGYVRQTLLGATANHPAAFAINHGDLMGDDLTLFPDHLRILDETGIPWHHCPGNHDMNLDARDSRHALEGWKQFIGPVNYAFQYGGATFILLNNVDYFGSGNAIDACAYQGRIGADQLAFTANVLANVPADALVVVSMHIPLASFANPGSGSDTTRDRDDLLGLLARRPYTVSFSGHSHTTEHHYFGKAEGFDREEPHHHHVLTAACGSWWSGPLDENGLPIADSRDGTPKGFHVLSVEGNRYATRFVATGGACDQDVRVFLQDAGQTPSAVEGARPALFVDVFDGGPKTRVTCEREGDPGSAFELWRTGVADPYVVEAFARYRERCKPWVAAAPSSHVWSAPLPQSFEGAGQALVVHVTGEYGRKITRRVALA